MHYGAMEGHKAVVELLIDRYNLSATDKDKVSLSCLRHRIGLTLSLCL